MVDGFYDADALKDDFVARRQPKLHNIPYQFPARGTPSEAEYSDAVLAAAFEERRIQAYARQQAVARRTLVVEKPIVRVPIVRRTPIRKG